jgi:hypothetical protein
MVKYIKYTLVGLTFIAVASCDVLEEVLATVPLVTQPAKPSLTNQEVISGLKEALERGIENSVNLTSITDGFLGNSNIRLPFPADAQKVKDKALEWGLDAKVNEFETTLNRAAEEATKTALPIFKDAILSMSIQDGFSILKGGNGAATKFLRDNTSAQLIEAFKPKVDEAIAKVKLTNYWNPIITKYNTAMTLTNGQKINPDLNDYVTNKAIDGLFFMVEQEENKIRLDPVARVSDLLKKVFGSI